MTEDDIKEVRSLIDLKKHILEVQENQPTGFHYDSEWFGPRVSYFNSHNIDSFRDLDNSYREILRASHLGACKHLIYMIDARLQELGVEPNKEDTDLGKQESSDG